MIPREHYEADAPKVVGNQIRINHTKCKAGRDTRNRLYVKRTNNAILAYCHNCHDYGIVRTDGSNKRVSKRFLEGVANSVTTPQEATLPPDSILVDKRFVPPYAMSWLYRYGIDDEEIKNNIIMYSAALDRIILPYFERLSHYKEGERVCTLWQGRYVGGNPNAPKYLTMKGKLFTQWLQRCDPHSGTFVYPSRLLVTEDILSAIKGVRHCDTLALLGTHVTEEHLALMLRYNSVGVFLDNDEAGFKASRTITARLHALGHPVAEMTGSFGSLQYKDLDAAQRQAVMDSILKVEA